MHVTLKSDFMNNLNVSVAKKEGIIRPRCLTPHTIRSKMVATSSDDSRTGAGELTSLAEK
jgi:hypothetical protein